MLTPEENNMYLDLIIGYPGSGKTTMVSSYKPDCSVWINPDDERWVFYSKQFDLSRDNELVQITQRKIIDYMRLKYKLIIIDEILWFLTRRSRQEWINIAKSFDYWVRCIYITTSWYECCRANKNRPDNKIVPQSAMWEMKMMFEIPTQNEGFNELLLVDRNYNPWKLWSLA